MWRVDDVDRHPKTALAHFRECILLASDSDCLSDTRYYEITLTSECFGRSMRRSVVTC